METIAIIMMIFGVVGLVIWQGLKKIPANPPQKGVVTFLGKRTKIVVNEGWVVLLGYPFIFGVILVDMTKKNVNMAPKGVRTPDMAEIEVETAMTFQPDRKNLIEYLNSKGESGVTEIAQDVIDEAVRELAISKERPPDTWEQAVSMKGDFSFEILLKIEGIPIPDSSEDREKLKKEKADLLKSLRVGNGTLEVPSLGIIINRLNVKNVQPKGKLVEAAEKLAIERREMQAEAVELKHIRDEVAKLNKDLSLSAEQSLELIQTERGKVVKTVNETKFSVAQESREAIKDVVVSLAKVLKGENHG